MVFASDETVGAEDNRTTRRLLTEIKEGQGFVARDANGPINI